MSDDFATRSARYYLERDGAEVLEEGYATVAGTIDLIFREGDEMVFALTRGASGLSLPAESLTEGDRRRMETAAADYLSTHDMESCRVRFDVFRVARLDKGKTLLCHHRDAFGEPLGRESERGTQAGRFAEKQRHGDRETLDRRDPSAKDKKPSGPAKPRRRKDRGRER